MSVSATRVGLEMIVLSLSAQIVAMDAEPATRTAFLLPVTATSHGLVLIVPLMRETLSRQIPY
jgi:hypothetical protein